MQIEGRKILAVILLFIICGSGTSVCAQIEEHGAKPSFRAQIPHEEIIQQGIKICTEHYRFLGPFFSLKSQLLRELQQWYNAHPQVAFASCIDTTMTVKFIDGASIVLFDVFSTIKDQHTLETQRSLAFQTFYPSTTHTKSTGYTALLLNPSEYLYGHRQCQRIANILFREEYNVVYRANQDVTIPYLRQNFSADIIYMDTHAGYWDVDGDQQPDIVVIATGEDWTNDTPQKYPFEYENHFIVEGIVGQRSIVAFTPAFIEYYYHSGDFPDSLVYMATCYASYDDSMAQAFLSAGADAYIGWTKNTVFWTNSDTSVQAFRLLAAGCSVKQTCSLIRYGGFYNWVLRSKLVYFGEGTHVIPRDLIIKARTTIS